MKHRYSEEQVIILVKDCYSIRELLFKLDIIPAGGNYRTINKFLKKNEINTSHFHGQLWNKGKTTNPKRPITEYLNNNYQISSYKLKLRLIKEGYFQSRCFKCNLIEWLNQPIPLELHHIDGNSNNNNLTNLQLLCPNCHSTTSNYRGHNILARRQHT